MHQACLLIPFYNEEERFNYSQLSRLLESKSCKVLMIDDGSDDSLVQNLSYFQEFYPQTFEIIRRTCNSGKAEALRSALNYVNISKYRLVGFTDADFSAGADVIAEFLSKVYASQSDVFHAIRPLSRDLVKTTLFRRLLGLMFQSLTKLIFQTRLGDTQCGLKMYSSDFLSKIDLASPFTNEWLFDIEVLLRSNNKTVNLRQISLPNWEHRKNGKISIQSTLFVLPAMIALRFRYGNLRHVAFSGIDR